MIGGIDIKGLKTEFGKFKAQQKFKAKRPLISEKMFLEIGEAAEKCKVVDLYYKQRDKAKKEIYIKHVTDKLETQIKQIEIEATKKTQSLIDAGGLFADDVQKKEGLLEAEQAKKEQLMLKCDQIQKKHEDDVNDALSSDRSKYGDKLDITTLTQEAPDIQETTGHDISVRKLAKLADHDSLISSSVAQPG